MKKRIQHLYLCIRIPFIGYNFRIEEKYIKKTMTTNQVLTYKFSQIFGYKGPNQKIQEEDIITALKFDPTGKYIAVGDKAGRIIVFKNEQSKKVNRGYDYLTQMQAHAKQFDPLRSMDIEQEIKGLQWMSSQGKYHKMVTCNERTIKLWKIHEKASKKIVKNAGKDLTLPKLQNTEIDYVAQAQKIFPNKHLTPINSITKSGNQEYLLASDQNQILLWSFQKPQKPFIVLNGLDKNQKEQSQEEITCSKYHPKNDSLFVYGGSKGLLQMADLRVSSSLESGCIAFGNPPKANYLYELISCVSSIDFASSGKNIISRDYLTVKIWDICNPKKPVSTINLNEGMKPKLCEMVENQAIYDNFFISASPNSNNILTGSYNNYFHVLDGENGVNAQYQLNYKRNTLVKQISKGVPIPKMDYMHKIQVGDCHPKANMLAVASLNCFFVYST